jgi:hypothetical protein
MGLRVSSPIRFVSATRHDCSKNLAELREVLQAERKHLLAELSHDCARLSGLRAAGDRNGLDRIVLAYRTLIAIVEREDFRIVEAERLPVVIEHISSRLERLADYLRSSAMALSAVKQCGTALADGEDNVH